MSSKLFNFYSFDECSDEDKLFNKLDLLKNESKIHYTQDDNYLIKIKDLELTDDEIEKLSVFLDSLNVLPYLGYEEEMDNDFDDYDDDSDDDNDDNYNGRYKSRNDDYDDDY
jgi:hypothetical protein